MEKCYNAFLKGVIRLFKILQVPLHEGFDIFKNVFLTDQYKTLKTSNWRF